MKSICLCLAVLVIAATFTTAQGQSKSKPTLINGIVKIEKILYADGKTAFKENVISGAVVKFTDEKGEEFSAKTDEKGKYEIYLLPGKYKVYSTANEKCWMCTEYYENEFLVIDKNKIKLNILLQFQAEG